MLLVHMRAHVYTHTGTLMFKCMSMCVKAGGQYQAVLRNTVYFF